MLATTITVQLLLLLFLLVLVTLPNHAASFQRLSASRTGHPLFRTGRTEKGRKRTEVKLSAKDSKNDNGKAKMEYRNAPTEFLSNFMMSKNKDKDSDKADPLAGIDFNAAKIKKTSLAALAEKLDAELYEKEWFVTGNVNPAFFADSFQFQDPDVKLNGIEDYARGVNKLFDQETSRAEIISTVVNATVPDTITVKWRLSGKVNIGPAGLTIKPYIVFTDLSVDPLTGLIVFQEDRFDIPQWDILLSSLFPFLIGRLTAPPAPPVPPRTVKKTPSAPKKLFDLKSIFQ